MKRFLLLAVIALTMVSAYALETVGRARVSHEINTDQYTTDIVWLSDGSKCVITYSTRAITQSCNISPAGPK